MRSSQFPVILFAVCLLLPFVPQLCAQKASGSERVELFPWESAGVITKISGKTVSIRRILKTSDSSWSFDPGAIPQLSELEPGDQILAKGKTQPDGTFDTKRIYMVSPVASRHPGTGPIREQAVDHGAPESRISTRVTDPTGTHPESRGRGEYPGSGRQIPIPGGPPSGPPAAGGLQTGHTSNRPRFFAGDAEGVIERIDPQAILLGQTFYVENETVIRNLDGRNVKLKDLKVGQPVAVTVKDELDSKTQAIKASVFRLLPIDSVK